MIHADTDGDPGGPLTRAKPLCAMTFPGRVIDAWQGLVDGGFTHHLLQAP